MEKEYVCDCGRIFNAPNAFNGHKASCDVHLLKKYGNLDSKKDKIRRSIETLKKTNESNRKVIQKAKLEKWISEKHKCEKCGKIMTTFFGTGRFCSSKCANSRTWTDADKKKKSLSYKKHDYIGPNGVTRDTLIQKYYQNPKICSCCGITLPYEKRHRKTCSEKCAKLSFAQSFKNNKTKNIGGIRQGAGRSKSGWYKGFFCDSTYELVFVIYNIDHNIPFERNRIGYEYLYNGESHLYYPDFLMSDGTLVEIKGYHTELVDIKLAAVKDKKIKILYEKDLEPYFEYVKNEYHCSHLQDLYEQKTAA